jgi:hypothetical protein
MRQSHGQCERRTQHGRDLRTMVCPDLRSTAHLTARVATPLVTKFAMVAVQLIGPGGGDSV